LNHAVLLNAVQRLRPKWHAWQRATAALLAGIALAWAFYLAADKPCARLCMELEW
jgi:peptidoglycan/LPS O-acetylase OafA/YrhL